MLSLLMLPPPGKFESTVKGLKAHYIPNRAFDITKEIRLGGQFSPILRGPTPAGLVPPNVPALVPGVPLPILQFTGHSPQAMNAMNWRV